MARIARLVYGVRDVKKVVPKEASEAADFAEIPPYDVITFDFKLLRDKEYRVKLNAGAATLWSEASTIQTLDNMLLRRPEEFPLEAYVELLPEGHVPDRQKLLTILKKYGKPMQQQTPPIPLPQNTGIPQIPAAARM
jgi:hypothetical protein